MATAAAADEAPASSYQQLVTLFSDWRAFNHPAIVHGRPDYSGPAMTKKAKGLAAFRARLKAINPGDWPTDQKNDYRVVEAEMNGLDFFLRILGPMTTLMGPSSSFSMAAMLLKPLTVI